MALRSPISKYHRVTFTMKASAAQEIEYPLHVEEGFSLHGYPANTIEIAEGVLAPQAITPIRQVVPGLGGITLLNRHELRGNRIEDPKRPDRWFAIGLDGYEQGIRVTEADPKEDSGVNLVRFPGLTEKIQDGPSSNLHDGLARRLPGVRLISVETDGVGDVGQPLEGDVWDHGLDSMAEQRLKLLKALCGESPTIVIGTSMGSVIANIMLDKDRKNGRHLNVHPFYFASAIVPPERTLGTMALLFLPAMAIDTSREILQMAIEHGPCSLKSYRRYYERLPSYLLPIARQTIDLLRGVPVSQVERVTESYHGNILSGALDPLANQPMWRNIKSNFPAFSADFIPWRGHGIAANGEGAAKKIARVLRENRTIEKLAV